ncbi:unnamed protein product [Ceutorhynchus assimilis]|uniref:MANSC domain-containing protein n=1 Tax=Ceutorhynchus assimilis TaxID=467358 RepID=A0A9P0DEG5_9CUCU|nr:unnamed protein product [Ceutorhynchus assimilis]
MTDYKLAAKMLKRKNFTGFLTHLAISSILLSKTALGTGSQLNLSTLPHEKLLPTDFSTNPLLRTKRAEIDIQTCIENFNVHRDKIIRTQDSQNMGAKYLNEIDLGSREECLRLCCETENCDVFVFEEKNSGSCYLFHCGPPEDFKCKFTHHVNYSSAVLSINRRLPDLESQIKLTKHVQDLTKLRMPELESPSEILRPETIKPTPATTLTPVITKEVLPLPLDKQVEARKCSRYQFECRSTGECIAIYNACDGIPQCADGSDEAHELGCPALEAVASAVAQTTPTPAPKNLLPLIHQVPAGAQTYGREGELVQQPKLQPQSNYQNFYHPQAFPQIPLQAENDFLRPAPRNPERAQYEPLMPVPNYLPNNWALARQQMAKQGIQQVQQYQDPSNQVYSHKDKTSHNEGQMGQLQYPEYQERLANYYGENYRQPLQQENWLPDESRYPQQVYHPQENAVPMIPAKTEGTSHVAEPMQPAVPNKPSSVTVVNSKHVQEKMAHDLKHSKENMEHGSSQTKIKPLQDQFAEPYKMTDDTQDGLSHIPRGAILSLTLGLIITGVMAILIGCRLRVVRRRLRKGGKGYAHDADYLVNGMYL